MGKRLLATAASAVLAVAALGGCSESSDETIVFAAASLTEVFPLIAEDFEGEVNFSFDGSSGLRDQIQGGAQADVFGSADWANMEKAIEAGIIDGDPHLFAMNYLTLVVPAGNPGGVTGFDDSLADAKLVICAPEVPCGAVSARVADAAGLTLSPVSEEMSVTDVLGKVTSGEADAGLVYATDAARAGEAVEVFEIAEAADDPTQYWIAIVDGAENKSSGQDFIDLVLDGGTDVLSEFGFAIPVEG